MGDIVAESFRTLRGMSADFEIIVVDDGSTDGTAEAAGKAGAMVIKHPYRRGYGAALKTGVNAARGDKVVFLDADGQHDPADIPKLLGERGVYDMVVGMRRGGSSGSPTWRKPGKFLLGALANNLTRRQIPDLNSGYRAMDRNLALRLIPILPDGFSFSTTITIGALKSGYTINYVPIEVKAREGKSSVTFMDGVNTFMLILRIISLFSPMRVFLPVSALTIVAGLYFVIYNFFSVGQPGIKGTIVVLAGVLFFLFGLMADQIAALRRGEYVR